MPDLNWNHAVWNESHSWPQEGDEWSVAWGGSRAQWYGAIYPRVSRFLPASHILEIAPGRGRWTQFLLPLCNVYSGVEFSANCVESCQRRFANASRAHFYVNDGRSLDMIADGSIDFVFSFDSLVHVEIDVIREYIWQLCAKLTPMGVAFIHHSNGGSEGISAAQVAANARAQSVSAALVRQLVDDCAAKILVQEEVNWAGESRIDCMSTFCRKGSFADSAPCFLQNDHFMAEAEAIRRFQSPYGAF